MSKDDISSHKASSTAEEQKEDPAPGGSTGGTYSLQKTLMGSMKPDHPLKSMPQTKIALTKFLGSGGEGKVYLGRINELKLEIAIKQFEVIANPVIEKKIAETISKEMQLVKNLEHPNVVKFYTIHKSMVKDINNGVTYNLLMEYMKGGSLDSWLALKPKAGMKL